MGANGRDYDPTSYADRLRVFMGAGEPEAKEETLARLEAKLDALTAALVKPQSSIILVGDDIARIAAELNRRK